MKLVITREWFERKVSLEGDDEIAAGALARDPTPDPATAAPAGADTLDATRVAFSSLVEYMRRKRGMSMEKLAEEANIELAEVVSIERDAHFRPEVRTVYKLSQCFDLPNKVLMELSGNTTSRSSAVHEHALRFAARSGESVQNLSREEKRALEEFIAFLAKQ
jgi:transcriptional regulator with XRE-family HTH domain